MPGNGGWPLVAEGFSTTAARNQMPLIVSNLGRQLQAAGEIAAPADTLIAAW